MKKIFLLTVLCLAINAPSKAFAYDFVPSSTPEMQRIQQSSFERFAPQRIKESYERKEAAENANNQSQQKIEEKINQIEQSSVYSGQVQNIKKKGYNTLVNFILCDTSLAIKRTKERALKINRHVPEQLILDRAKGIENYIKTYKTIASNVNLLDGTNNFAPLKKI